MTDETPIASIIVPSYRGARRLPALLDSFAGQDGGTPAFEVIVVIDGVDDGSVALLAAEDRFPVCSIVFPENRGRVVALNAGFEAARGQVLIRCDDDLVVPSGFVGAHVRFHTSAGRAGGVGLTQDIHEMSAYARAYGEAAATSSFAAASARGADERWRLWAANCSITRETWEEIGPYSSAYRAYGWEDVDYGYRLHAAGIPVGLVDGATAEHHGPARSAAARTVKAYEAGAARATFLARHPEAPLPVASAGSGAWGLAVGSTARLLRSARGARTYAAAVDRLLPAAPPVIGRKLVALGVEAAGLAGSRQGVVAPKHRAEPADVATGGAARPRIAIAHDYLTQRGGAERVVLSLARAFPDAEIHTLFYEPDQTYPEFRDMRIRTSGLNRIGPFRRDPRIALPLLATASSRMTIDADIVIASSSGWAHAFPTDGRKIVYCHSPARWLYLPEDYLGDAGRLDPKRLLLSVLTPALKVWDRRAAMTAHRYLANSSVVRERIRRVYRIDAPTLFPPFSPAVAEGEQEPIPELASWAGADGTAGGHFLVVSRLQPYKHVDRVIEAFGGLPDERLLVIGKGPEKERLVELAGENVRLIEGLSDAQMRWAYGNARALVAASHEDFGLTPLEAGAHGVPTIALRAGGYLDTVEEGVNGLFFEEPTAEAIREAVHRFDENPPEERTRIIDRAARFSEEHFVDALRIEAGKMSGVSA